MHGETVKCIARLLCLVTLQNFKNSYLQEMNMLAVKGYCCSVMYDVATVYVHCFSCYAWVHSVWGCPVFGSVSISWQVE
jgi:hypothetical protein